MAMCPYLQAECVRDACALWDADAADGAGDCCHREDVRIRRGLLNGSLRPTIPAEDRYEEAMREIMAAAVKHGFKPQMVRAAIEEYVAKAAEGSE